MAADRPPLAGVRVIESAMLGPGAITTHLADMGAEVIKVEPPAGDYIREMTWPIVEGVSLMHLHIHRGKQSITLDLRTEDRDLPAHGIAFDTWAGVVSPAYDEEGFCYIPEHASIGIHAGPVIGALGILAGVIRARETGEGCLLEIGQSDAAAYMDWYRSESHKAYDRPQSEVTGNKADNYERRAVGTAGMKEGVRYQMYDSADGHVLFMASEQAFWKSFCECVGRVDLFDRWPGSKYADHARGNRELQRELREIFKARTSEEWIRLGDQKNFPVAPVNTPKTIADDPQFQDRFPWYPASKHGADMLPFPVRFLGEDLPEPSHAPTVGEHTDRILSELLGYDSDRIGSLRKAGAFGEER
jgi:crotonobetainyl-CoA:carnitine CoA-transferase CaiB-like acyl-CoA transferase